MGALPGQVAYNSTVPFGAQTLDQAAWSTGIAMEFIDGIIREAIELGGDASRVGLPASWPYGPLARNAVKADGSISPLLASQVQAYVNSPAALNDADFALEFGAPMGSSLPAGGYIDKPLTPSEKLAAEQQSFNQTQALLKLATGGSSSSGSSGGTYRSSSSGGSSGGGAGGGQSLDAQRAEDAQSLAAHQAKRDIDLAYQRALHALEADPNNPELIYRATQLAETQRQFDEQMAYQRQKDAQSLGLERARTFADYSANPGDAVAREYFLRQGANPVGNAINIFTGQPTGQQMTLSEVMQANAPLVGPALQGQMAGTPPPVETPEPLPTPGEETPQFAFGTRPEVTTDGWTKANKFITGDHPMGRPNPELNEVRVRNGQPETRVTPLSKMLGRRKRIPMYASGTDGIDPNDPWAWQNNDWNQADSVDSFGNFDSLYNPNNLAQPQSGSYQESTAISPTYNTTGQSNIAFGDPANPYVNQRTSGVPTNASTIAADPFYGTAYQGMDPSATVTNANSQYYGMSAQDAFDAMVRNNTSLAPYSGSLDALGQVTGSAPLTVVGPTADIPSMYGSNGYSRPYTQVANQGDAGILTGAQMSSGVTQSADPGAPGYVRPDYMPPLPSTSATQVGNLWDDQINRSVDSGAPGGPNITEEPIAPVQATPYRPVEPGTVTRDGATYQLNSGDYQLADGTYVRYDPLLKEYMPIQPGLTPIRSRDEFWSLPPSEQQKILTGQPTGYALVGNWRDNLFAGFNTPNPTMTPEKFAALSDAEKQQAMMTPQHQTGVTQDPQYLTRKDYGPMQSGLSGLLSLPSPTNNAFEIPWGSFATQAEADRLFTGSGDPQPQPDPGTLMKPWDDLSTAIEEKPDARWQIYTNPRISNNGATLAIGPDGSSYSGMDGIWKKIQLTNQEDGSPITTFEQLSTFLTNNGYSVDTSYSPSTGTSSPAPAAPTGTGVTTNTSGTSGGSGTTSGSTTSTGNTGTSGGTDTISQIAQLLGLSYGDQTYQNLPALQYALGNLAGGDYGNISNEPIEVPGLGLSLPGASSMMNYEMLQNLIQNGSFDLLNSLYTAGNVPLSLILKIAQARAPLGNAYDAGMIETV